MTRDTIDMAREAGPLISTPFDLWCERFADLVRADEQSIEREACAKVCDAVLNEDGNWTPIGHRFAAAIRARGNT